jgi:Chaperone of endosialidase
MKNLFADRANFGGTVTAQTAPLRLGALGARAAGAVLSVNASGDVTSGALQVADIPSPFTRRDVAETISQPWNPTGLPWTFSAGASGAAPPNNTPTGGVGTRIIYYPNAGFPYSVGIEGAALWHCVPTGNQFRWYNGAELELHLTDTGTLRVPKSGILELINTASYGQITGQAGITVDMPSGFWAFHCPNVWPTTKYWTNLGTITNKYLTLHAAELWVETLVAQNTMATIGGRILVGPTNVTMQDWQGTDPVDYWYQHTICKYNNLQIGDIVLMEADGKFEMMQVEAFSPSGANWLYRFTRNLDGSGANDWYAGDAIFNTGQTGNGFIDLYSLRGVKPGSQFGPTIVGNVRNSMTFNDWRERWAIGNLNGLYGNAGNVYGVAFGVPNTGLHVQVDDTDGITFRDSAQTRYAQWSMTGEITIGYPTAPNIRIAPTGNIELRRGSTTTMALDAATGDLMLIGNLRSGATAFGSGIGYWLGWNGGSPQFRVGNPIGNKVEWDSVSLRVVSNAVSIDPTTGITINAPPSEVANRANGLTITGLSYAGISGLWGFEGSSKRTLYFENRPDTPYTGAEIFIRALSSFSAAGESSLRLRSNAYAYPEFIVQATDVTIGHGGYQYLQFGSAANSTFAFRAAGGTAGHVVPGTDNLQDVGLSATRWRYAFIGTAVGIALGGNPAYQLQLGADSAGKPTSSTWTIVASDARTKRDVVPVTRALDRVCAVQVVDFTYNGAFGTPEGDRGIGLIAQDAQAVLPHSIRDRGDGVFDWNAHELFMLNVVATQELAARVAALEKERA